MQNHEGLTQRRRYKDFTQRRKVDAKPLRRKVDAKPLRLPVFIASWRTLPQAGLSDFA